MENVSVTWADESKNAVLCTYVKDGWTWEDFYEALKRQNALIETSDAPTVDVLVDVRKTNWMPRGGTLLTGIRKVKTEQHKRQGETIIVGAQGIVAAIARVANKLLGKGRQGMHFAKTMEEAQELRTQFNTRRQTKTTAAR